MLFQMQLLNLQALDYSLVFIFCRIRKYQDCQSLSLFPKIDIPYLAQFRFWFGIHLFLFIKPPTFCCKTYRKIRIIFLNFLIKNTKHRNFGTFFRCTFSKWTPIFWKCKAFKICNLKKICRICICMYIRRYSVVKKKKTICTCVNIEIWPLKTYLQQNSRYVKDL